MVRVGLTGGLACGKSTIGHMMAALGAHLLEADTIAHALMKPGEKVHDEVVKRFGAEIVDRKDGSIDRARLADAAFGPGRIAELNSIVHPAVIERQNAWLEEMAAKDPKGVAVVEAALILEAGARERFDKLVVVTCPHGEKIDRYVKRTITRNSGPLAEIRAHKEAERRIAAQMPDAEKVKAADFVIDNGGTLQHTERQVARLMEDLKQLAQVS